MRQGQKAPMGSLERRRNAKPGVSPEAGEAVGRLRIPREILLRGALEPGFGGPLVVRRLRPARKIVLDCCRAYARIESRGGLSPLCPGRAEFLGRERA